MYYLEKTHEAPQQVFWLLFYSLSYFIGAARCSQEKFVKCPVRKNKYTARMLADARKDHSIPLMRATSA